MNRMARRKTPARAWLPVVIPVAVASILLSAAWVADHNWLVVLCCFAAGAVVPLTATLVMLRDHKLFLTDAGAIEENKRRIAASRPLG